MSMVVKLEDQQGERGEWAMLHGVIPGHDERDFPVLRGVDPYGTTVFNHLQMEELIFELRRIRQKATTEEQRAFVDAIEGMAGRCKDGEGLYLKFIGD